MVAKGYLVPALALSGLLAGIALVARGNVVPPVAQPIVQPAVAPFQSYIAGSGMIESSTRNVAITTPVAGQQVDVYIETLAGQTAPQQGPPDPSVSATRSSSGS